MNSVNTLRRARDLISDPEKWTKGGMGRKSDGDPVGVYDVGREDVVKWCMSGALRKVADNEQVFNKAYWSCMSQVPVQVKTSLPRFNDHPSTTHQDVMFVFDQAIAKEVVSESMANMTKGERILRRVLDTIGV